MNKRNKIQETYESSFEQYKDKVDYDIILEGTIGYEVVGADESSTPTEEQLQDGEEKIFEQIKSLINNEDFLYDIFEDTGIARGRIYGEFTDQEVNDNKLYFKLGISKEESTKKLDVNEIKEYFEQFLEDLGSNVDLESVMGWSNEEEDVEPTHVELDITGKPEIKILKNETESVKDNKITESKIIDSIDRKLVMEGKLAFIKENNIKSIILNDDGIMELYENKKLIDSKPFSKLGVQRLYKSIIQEGYSIYITTGEYPVYSSKKYDTVDTEEQAQDIVAELNSQGISAGYEKDENLQEDVKSDEIKDSNGDNIDLKQTKQNIEQSIEKVDELQNLKDELQDKVDNLYNESKIEEEKITSFVSTPFTQQLLSTEEIYNLKLEEELTVEQVAYITKLFGSLEEFKNNLIQLTDIASMPPQIHFISIDEYIKEMEKEFDKEVN